MPPIVGYDLVFRQKGAGVLVQLILFVSLILSSSSSFCQENEVEMNSQDGYVIEDISLAEELAITQSEWREQAQRTLYLGLGGSLPWQDYGMGFTWTTEQSKKHWGINLGSGNFELSSYQDGRALFSDVSIVSAWISHLSHFKDYPIFLDSFVGFSSWNSELRLRANELNGPTNNLLSDGSIQDFSLGARLGLVWHFSNRMFTDVSLIQFSKAWIVKQSFTENDALSRKIARNQVESFRTWGGLNLRIGIRL